MKGQPNLSEAFRRIKISRALRGKKRSQETKMKMSEVAKRRLLTEKGKRQFENYKRKRVLTSLGSSHTPEHKRKISEELKNFYSKNPVKEETRAALSKAAKERIKSEEGRQQWQIVLDKAHQSRKGSKLSDEAKQRLSERNKKWRETPDGKRLFDKFIRAGIEKARLSHLGKPLSQEHKEKISKALSGEKHFNFGKHLSEETKVKIRKARLNQKILFRDTSIELKVKNQLERAGINFFHPWNLKLFYQCDFFIPSLNLIIECDGTYWHSLEKNRLRDIRKDKYAKEEGYNMLRLSQDLINTSHFDIMKYLEVPGND